MLDEKIIRLCIEGDRISQEKLYNYYASRMRGICVRYSKSEVEAEDIFQDAFIKVFNNIKKFNNNGSFDGWIRRIVTNTAIDHYRKNLIISDHIEYDMTGDDHRGSIEITHELEEQDLLKILNQLPPGYKLIFNLFAIEGFSHKEISEMLNISQGTSKSQLTKARKLIRTILEKKKILENEIRTA
jgi:RNA polymerase sigma factor (sigma-70 family)